MHRQPEQQQTNSNERWQIKRLFFLRIRKCNIITSFFIDNESVIIVMRACTMAATNKNENIKNTRNCILCMRITMVRAHSFGTTNMLQLCRSPSSSRLISTLSWPTNFCTNKNACTSLGCRCMSNAKCTNEIEIGLA